MRDKFSRIFETTGKIVFSYLTSTRYHIQKTTTRKS